MELSGVIAVFIVAIVIIGVVVLFWAISIRKALRETKNFERGLKMVPMLIHLPPASDDLESGSRDKRDLTDEALSQAQVMYNIISSTATKGFKSKLYGQRAVSFEVVAREGIVHYYVVVPTVMTETIKQAVAAAYPSARLEETTEHNVFSKVGKMSGTIGGEFTLKKHYSYPIATYMETKRDASRALLNALSAAGKEDGIGVQFIIRPAKEGWAKHSISKADKFVKEKTEGKKSGGWSGLVAPRDILEALWRPPESSEKDKKEKERRELNAAEKSEVEAIHEKAKYPGYESLIRVVVSSNTSAKAQSLLANVVSAFSLFDSASFNGFKFTTTKSVDNLITAYIMRFFPQDITGNILNSVELATIFHLPDHNSIPTSQVKRQMAKQVDGPTDVMDEGPLLGYNEFRGVKKPIRISNTDRRRHLHIIGQTGVGKSGFMENLAYQDMMEGRGFAFVDPHGDSAEAILSRVPPERVEDIIYFDPSDMEHPIGLNMFEFEHEDQKDFLVQEAIAMLYSLYDPGHSGIVGPRLEHIFRNCALLLMSDPKGGTFIDIPKLLTDQEFMKSKLKYVTDQQVLDFWTKEFPASQRSNEAGEVISWVVSKFGPFISNITMRNIIGQTKSGFDISDIMNNKKILIVNLSKGKLGDLNAKLLGIIFVMKFQAAAMARAKMREEDRQDFTLYVDEFQNFATDSFETILSEARKYRLSLVIGNQFMTQLKEELREAIIGNVGTTVTGRIGSTDAEIMVKRYQPVFDAEDLTKIPNYQAVCVLQLKGVPSAPFSMSLVPPMGHPNKKLMETLIQLSASKHARTRSDIEHEITQRMAVKKPAIPSPGAMNSPAGRPLQTNKPNSSGTGSSFLDDWLAKRKKLGGGNKPPTPKIGAPVGGSVSQGANVNAIPSRPQTGQQNTVNTVSGSTGSLTTQLYGDPVVAKQSSPPYQQSQGTNTDIKPVQQPQQVQGIATVRNDGLQSTADKKAGSARQRRSRGVSRSGKQKATQQQSKAKQQSQDSILKVSQQPASSDDEFMFKIR